MSDTRTDIIPAKSIDKAPQFQFVVISVRKGTDTAELESSFELQSQAERMFERQYSKWGIPDTNFYLADWRTQTILKSHVVW